MKQNLKQQNAFTLVELLIVVLVISALVGITLTLLNITGTKEKAKDGVRTSNIQKIGEGIETFKTTEGFYPEEGTNNNPFTGLDAVVLQNYVTSWPQDENDVYIY